MPSKLQQFAQDLNAKMVDYHFDLEYDYWTSDQILRSILPDGLEVPSSFETIGHIGN
jgi:tRNA (guanine37-N1)-methyltransferase